MVAPSQTRLRIGKSGIVFLVVAGVVYCVASNTQNNLMFWALGLMLGGLLASTVLSCLMLRGLRLQRLLPEHAVAGEALIVQYQLLKQRGWLAGFNLVIQEVWDTRKLDIPHRHRRNYAPPALGGPPIGWVTHLPAGQVSQAQAIAWPGKRGMLEFERVRVSTSFPLGILHYEKVFFLPERVLVYPRLYRVQREFWHRLALADPAGHLHLERRGGQDEFFGLRPYQTGDRLRSIDWKHSVKLGQLIAREMTQPSPPRLMLELDLLTPPPAGQSHAEIQEQAINLAASVICAAHLQGYETGLVVRGPMTPVYRPHHSLQQRSRLLETLACLNLGSVGEPNSGNAGEPTLRITTGPPQPAAPRWCVTLSASQMERYAQPLTDGSTGLLARHTPKRAERAAALSHVG